MAVVVPSSVDLQLFAWWEHFPLWEASLPVQEEPRVKGVWITISSRESLGLLGSVVLPGPTSSPVVSDILPIEEIASYNGC